MSKAQGQAVGTGAGVPVTIITPTVGRVVWFTPHPEQDNRFDKTQPLAAIVAYVWHDRMVNLTVVEQDGISHAATSVYLVQPDETAPWRAAFCTWMPYQVGQAERTQRAESALGQSRGVGQAQATAGGEFARKT